MHVPTTQTLPVPQTLHVFPALPQAAADVPA